MLFAMQENIFYENPVINGNSKELNIWGICQISENFPAKL